MTSAKPERARSVNSWAISPGCIWAPGRPATRRVWTTASCPTWDPGTGLRVVRGGLRRLTARALARNTVLSFTVSATWQRADLVQVGPHRWAGCCHARRCLKVLSRSVGRSPQPPGELEPVIWSVASLPVRVQARRAEAGAQAHQLYAAPYTAREYPRSAGLIRVDCLRSQLTRRLSGPWTHQLPGSLQAVGHHGT